MSMRQPTPHRFSQVDVFTDMPLRGNPLAVVHDAGDLDDADMAAFARWTNLSETTFLLPPTAEGAAAGADYRVRIFTPTCEFPFAGHPTLGSCQAWLSAGGRPRAAGMVVQECGVGLVDVRRDGGRLAFAAPPCLRFGPETDAGVREQVCRALRVADADVLALHWVDNGPGWLGVRLADAAQVLALKPDFAAMGDLKLGVVGAHPPGHDAQFEVRAFAPGQGINEDPVTGSLNASLGQWLTGAGLAPSRYVAAQGTAIGRAGRVHLSREGEVLWVGGTVWPVVSGIVQV
jgi:PhzF family phenazine biosynthesis protein